MWHLYVVRHVRRDALAKALAERGVGTVIHYPVPPHLQPAYAPLGIPRGALPIAEALHEQVLSLPMGPTLSLADADAVIKAVMAAVRACA